MSLFAVVLRQFARAAAVLAFVAAAVVAAPAHAQFADLVVNQLDSPDPGPAGTVVTYTVRVDNNGPNAAIGVTFSDTLPPGSTFISATPTQGSCGAPVAGVLSCALGNLTFLANATVTIQLRLPTPGVWTNTATAGSSTPDPNTTNNVNVAESTTALNAADMTLIVTDAPDPSAAGAPFNFTVTARNNGPTALAATDTQTMTFPVPAGACIRSVPTGTGWVCTGSGGFPLCSGTVSCTRTGAVAANANAPAITVPAVGNVAGAITGTFTVGSSLPDGNPADNTVTDSITITGGSSDVQITKTASAATIQVGANVTYTLTPRFNGGEPPGTLPPNLITVTDTLNAGLTFVSAAGAGWTCGFAAPTVTCTRPGPYAGGRFTNMPVITIVATVTATGVIGNTAVISAPETDPVPANNTSATVNITGSVTADLSMTKTASLNPIVVGQNFTYSLVARNTGPVPVTAGNTITVTDTLPAGMSLRTPGATGAGWVCSSVPAPPFPIAGPVTITCTRAGPLAINTNAPTITVPVVTTSGAALVNTACVALTGTTSVDTNAANNCSAVTVTSSSTSADLRAVSKTASPNPVNVGQDLTYTITVQNFGPDSATNVTVSDTLASLVGAGGFQSATPSQGVCVPAGVTAGPSVTLSCNLGTLANGASATVVVVVRPTIATTGNRVNTATVRSPDVGDPLQNNNSASVTSVVTAVADVTVSKTAAPSPVRAGTPLTYVLTARNNGPSTASTVVATDTLPANATFVSMGAVTGGGICTSPPAGTLGGTVQCTWASINNATQFTATFVVRPITGAASVTNAASITTTTQEFNTANNSTSLATTVNAALVDLLINKSDSNDPVALGLPTVYTIMVGNGGPSFASNVVMTDTFPTGTPSATFSYQGGLTIAPPASGTCVEPALNATSGVLSCTFPGIASGSVVAVTYVMRAETVAAGVSGTTFNSASVTSAEAESLAANNSTSEATTARRVANLGLVKSAPASVAPGETFAWTLTITNNGPNTSTGAIVTDVLPAGVTFQSASPGCGFAAGTVTCTLGTLADGANTVLTINVLVAEPYTGANPLLNSATVATVNEVDIISANNTGSSSTPVTPRADLAVTKTDGVTTVVAGSTVVYTITASNAGPSAVTGATVADTFPATLLGATWTCSGALGGTCPAPSGSGNLNALVNLPSGGSVTFTVTGTLSPAATGTLVNTATVMPPVGTTDPTPGNNSATDTDTITPQADLSITKTDGSATAVPGNTVTYTIVASNAGPSAVTGATVNDTLPATLTGATWTCAGAGGGTCPAPSGSGNISALVNLPAGSSVTFIVTSTLSPAATGTLVNTATVTPPGGTTDPTPGNNSATDTDTINPTADLSITKTDGVATVVPGNNVTYTIVASNAGPSDVTGATVADTLPGTLSGATWTCAGAGGGTCPAPSGSGNISALVNLPVGGSVTFTLTATLSAAATGTLVNTATVTPPGGTTDPDPTNNTATDTDTLTPQVALLVTKSDGATTYTPGGSATYTVTIENTGASDAFGVDVSDALPAGVTLSANVSCAANGTSTCGTVAGLSGATSFSVTAARVNAGGANTIVLTVPVAFAAGMSANPLVNTATATDVPTGATDSDSDSDTLSANVTLAVTKTDGSATYTPGGTAAYTITVVNTGVSDALAVNVSDTLPAGVLLNGTVTCAANGTSSCGTVSGVSGGGSFGALAARVDAGAANTLVFTVPVAFAPGMTTDPLVNTVTATDQPSGNNATDSDSDAISPNVTLAVAKTDGSATYTPGGTATYVVTIENTGLSDALDVNVSDSLPPGVTLTGTATCVANGTSTCGTVVGAAGGTSFGTSNARVNAGGANTLVFTAPVAFAPAMTANPLINTATATDVPTGITANGSDSDALSANVTLAVTKTDGSATYTPGATATYTITVANTGLTDALDVTVADTLPAQVTLTGAVTCVAAGTSNCGTVSGAAGGGTLGALNAIVRAGAGNTLTFTAPVAFAANLVTDPLVNTATATDQPTGANASGSDSDTLNSQIAFAVTKTDGSATYAPGGTATYTVTVGNTGVSNATNVTIADPLPAGVLLTGTATCVAAGTALCGSVTGSAGGASFGATNAAIPAGGGNLLTFTAPVSFGAGMSANPLVNTVSATDVPTGISANASDSDTRAAQVVLAVTKTDGQSAYVPGGAATYTITVANTGTSDAIDVTIADTLPAGVTLTGTVTCVAAGTSNCGTVSGTTGGGALGAVNAIVRTGGAAGMLTFTAPVAFAAGMTTDPLVNTASATDVTSGANASGSDSDVRNATVVLGITKSDGTAMYTPGGAGMYVITVTNAGPATAVTLLVSDNLPPGVTLTGVPTCVATGTATCGTIAGAIGGSVFTATGATLAAGGANQLVYSVPVAFAAALTNNPLVNIATVREGPQGAVASASDANANANANAGQPAVEVPATGRDVLLVLALLLLAFGARAMRRR